MDIFSQLETPLPRLVSLNPASLEKLTQQTAEAFLELVHEHLLLPFDERQTQEVGKEQVFEHPSRLITQYEWKPKQPTYGWLKRKKDIWIPHEPRLLREAKQKPRGVRLRFEDDCAFDLPFEVFSYSWLPGKQIHGGLYLERPSQTQGTKKYVFAAR